MPATLASAAALPPPRAPRDAPLQAGARVSGLLPRVPYLDLGDGDVQLAVLPEAKGLRYQDQASVILPNLRRGLLGGSLLQAQGGQERQHQEAPPAAATRHAGQQMLRENEGSAQKHERWQRQYLQGRAGAPHSNRHPYHLQDLTNSCFNL